MPSGEFRFSERVLGEQRGTVNPVVASRLDSGQEEQAVEISVGVRCAKRKRNETGALREGQVGQAEERLPI